MTKEEIIKMARKIGIHYRELSEEFATGNGDGVEIEQMQAFAKLIAEKERESCAKLIESHGETLANGAILTEAIRARGQE